MAQHRGQRSPPPSHWLLDVGAMLRATHRDGDIAGLAALRARGQAAGILVRAADARVREAEGVTRALGRVFSADALGLGAPEDRRALFEATCRAWNVQPAACGYVSDSFDDLEAARRYGFGRCVGLRTDGGDAIEGTRATPVLEHLGDLALWLSAQERSSAGDPVHLGVGFTRPTRRLILRPFSLSDADAVFELASRQIDTRFLTWEPHATSEDTLAFVRFAVSGWGSGRHHLFLLERREDRCVLGWCGVDTIDWRDRCAHVGYCLGRPFEGHGYMTEAVRAIAELHLELVGFERLYTSVWEGNVASARVLDKAGFVHLGLEPMPASKNGRSFPSHRFERVAAVRGEVT